MKTLFIFLIMVFTLIVIAYCYLYNYQNSLRLDRKIKNPCSDYLTDREYLLHMIPHHQVAIDISMLMQKKSKNPAMQEILRKLIWTQKIEIQMMEDTLNNLPDKLSTELEMDSNYSATVADFTNPNVLHMSDTYCDPNFFDPEEHMKHLHHMELTDRMYIEHMIPHHQVAVDMSKKLLQHTSNDFMIYLSYRIIRSQENEIVLLNDLNKKGNINYKSDIL